MLSTKKNITLTGSSIIDGVIAEGYQAVIDSTNPANMTITSWQANKEVYKLNRVQCRQDSAEFEELAYAMQEELMADIPVVEPESAE